MEEDFDDPGVGPLGVEGTFGVEGTTDFSDENYI